MARALPSTNKSRPCPVCAKTNGNCRIGDNEQILCMSFPDGDGHPDYRFVKPSKDGLWGVHVPRTANDFDRQDWERRKAEKEERDRELERQRLEKCLDTDRRDGEIRNILSQLTLTDGDRRYLENRGVPTEVISRCRSIKQWQKLARPAHVNLPGVNRNGNRLNNPTDGILVPIPDHAGRYIVMRLHDPKAGEKNNGRKYSWLSSAKRGVSPHLPNGENPIGVFWPNGLPTATKPKRIGLCEGMEWKAPTSANRFNVPVIGFSGYQFLQSPELLRTAINAINPDAEIFIIPDAGAVQNRHIAASHAETLTTLETWGKSDSVAWWGQFTKADGDIDEIDGDRQIDFISPAQFLSYCPNRRKTPVEKFTDWLKKQAQRLKPKGFGAVKLEGEKFTGDRLYIWQRAIKRGETVLDNSLTGSGKSHDVSRVTNPHGGKIWYIYKGHRNPTVEAIAHEFVDLYPRNSQGFYRDSEGKIRPADAEHPATIKNGHCDRADLFPMLTELGHDPNDGGGNNPICQTCPMANVCAHTPGWYRHDRKKTLESANKIRCDIESMPRDWDYSKDIYIPDEPSQLFTPTKTISTTWGELLKEADRIRPNLSDLSPELWAELDAFLQALKPLFGNAPRYGLTHGEITAKLPTPSPELVEAIAANPLNLADLFPTVKLERQKDHFTPAEQEKWGAALKAYNAHQRQEQHAQTQANLGQLHPNALIHLVKGQAIRRLTGQTLTLTIDRRDDYSFIKRAAAQIFLDATLNGDRLRTLTGIEGKIKVCNDTPDKPLKNLTIHQIKVQGIGSKSISNTAINRIAAVTQWLAQKNGDMPTIALKSWAKFLDLDGYWWRDSRGTNDYAGESKLLALGLPNPNVGAIEDQFLALGGDPEQFSEHYARLVNEEILQLIGRQRANRYPDRQFDLFILTPEQTDLSWLTDYGTTLDVKTGFEITPAAGSQTQFTRWQIVQAILDGHKTQTAIAKVLGCTQQAISKSLKAAGVTLQSLIERISKFLPEMATTGPYKSYIRTSCSPDQLYKDFASFFELDMVAIAQDAIEMIKKDGWEGFLQILELSPEPVQAYTLAILYAILAPPPIFEDLA